MPEARVLGWAILAMAAVAALPVASAASLAFSAPAAWQGSLAGSHASWAFLMFEDGRQAQGSLVLPAQTRITNETQLITAEAATPYATSPYLTVPINTSSTLPAAADVSVLLGHKGIAGLYVEADSIAVSGSGSGRLDIVPVHSCVDSLLTGTERAGGAKRKTPDPCFGAPQAGVRLDNNGTTRLDVKGLRHAEWHNADVACQGVDVQSCPSGGARWTQRFSPMAHWRVEERGYGYDIIDPPTPVDFQLDGNASVVAFGGSAIDLDLAGVARLPGASLPQSCPTCRTVDGQTLWVEGNLTLSGLRAGPSGGLTGDFGGQVLSTRLDESSVAPALLFGGATAAVAAGLAVVGLVLWKLFPALFTRVLGDPLKHPARRRVFDAVCKDPGANYRAIMAATGLSDGAVRLHLARLERAGPLVSRPQGKPRLYFENHG